MLDRTRGTSKRSIKREFNTIASNLIVLQKSPAQTQWIGCGTDSVSSEIFESNNDQLKCEGRETWIFNWKAYIEASLTLSLLDLQMIWLYHFH